MPPWADGVAHLGWPVNAAYTEHCLVSVFGPTSTLALRVLASELRTGGPEDPMPIDLEAISRSLGSGTGRNGKLSKALLRLSSSAASRPSAAPSGATGSAPT